MDHRLAGPDSIARVERNEAFSLVAQERLRAANMFDTLGDQQWREPSLCGDWTVCDIAGHLVMPFLVGMRSLLWGMVVNRGDFDRFSSLASRQIAARPPAELVSLLRANAENRFTPPGLGPESPLTDACVHTRDAARPLGLPDNAPPSTWRVVLDFLTSPAARRVAPRGRLAGLRLLATDQDWSRGDGALVEGTSEALALAAVGRGVVLPELSGDGAAVLSSRLR